MESDPPVALPLPQPQPVGIYGWRKRCLYALILLLMVVVIVNLALTVWILRVLHFSIDGMGKLRIVREGIRMEGEAEFLRSLYVKQIKTYDETLHIESAKGIKLQAREGDNMHGGSLYLGNKKLQVACDAFEVLDGQGRVRLNITENMTMLGGDKLKYKGEAVFESSLQTPTVMSPLEKSLEISSVKGSVDIVGGQGVSISSTSGDIEINSDDKIIINSDQGMIFLDAANIFLENMSGDNTGKGSIPKADVYQLCICDSGRLFLSPSSGECLATEDTCDTT